MPRDQVFLSRVKMNATNWPAPNVWSLHTSKGVEQCSANAEAMETNPAGVSSFFFFRVYLQLLKLQLPLPRSYLYLKNFISAVHTRIIINPVVMQITFDILIILETLFISSRV